MMRSIRMRCSSRMRRSWCGRERCDVRIALLAPCKRGYFLVLDCMEGSESLESRSHSFLAMATMAGLAGSLLTASFINEHITSGEMPHIYTIKLNVTFILCLSSMVLRPHPFLLCLPASTNFYRTLVTKKLVFSECLVSCGIWWSPKSQKT